MASNTKATTVKRKNKHEKAGRRRKNKLAKKSTAVGDRAVRRRSASPASPLRRKLKRVSARRRLALRSADTRSTENTPLIRDSERITLLS